MGCQQEGTHCKENSEALGTKEYQNTGSFSMVSKGEMNGLREGKAGARPSSKCLVYHSKEFRFPF